MRIVWTSIESILLYILNYSELVYENMGKDSQLLLF